MGKYSLFPVEMLVDIQGKYFGALGVSRDKCFLLTLGATVSPEEKQDINKVIHRRGAKTVNKYDQIIDE